MATFREELHRLIDEYKGDARAEYHREQDEVFDLEQAMRREMEAAGEKL